MYMTNNSIDQELPKRMRQCTALGDHKKDTSPVYAVD